MIYREKTAELIKRGKNVALYCDGIFSSTNILYLDKFFGVRPAVVIDNDPRKKGFAELGVPVMSFAETTQKYSDLYYYIQGNTYIYEIIGDLISKGISPNRIINYAEVEKRDGCLIAETSIGVTASSSCNVCYECGFNYNKNNNTVHFDDLTVSAFEEQFKNFRDNQTFIQKDGSDCRTDCRMHKTGFYAKKPKIRLIGDYISDYCELSCLYCFLQELGMSKRKPQIPFNKWLDVLLKSDVIMDSLVLHLCPTEKTHDEDIDTALRLCDDKINAFEAIHLFSCCYAYRENLAPLLAKGVAKAFWSLDAGTEETFEKIKRKKNIFGKVLDNVEKYKKADVFDGFLIVPKYSIVKGVNDNERDFDGFVEICKRFNVKYCGIQWNYADNDNTSEEDFELVRSFYGKISEAGLKTTYTSGSTILSKALGRLAFYENNGKEYIS